MSKLDNFNPNSKRPPVIEWATFVPDRRTAPAFKVHKRKSDALSAVTEHSILYQLVDGEWVEVFKVDGYEKPDNCEVCNELLRVESTMTKWVPDLNEGRFLKEVPYVYHRGYRKWRSTTPGKISWIYLCLNCARKWRPEK